MCHLIGEYKIGQFPVEFNKLIIRNLEKWDMTLVYVQVNEFITLVVVVHSCSMFLQIFLLLYLGRHVLIPRLLEGNETLDARKDSS